MYDVERIGKMIADIEMYFKDLDDFGLNEKTIKDSKTVYSSSMVIFGIINRAIDLAEEIIVKNEWGMPSNYEEYFEVLTKNGVMDKKFSEEMKQLTKDRNTIAHAYHDIRKKEILDIKKRVYYVKDFVEKIKKVVKNRGGEK